MDKTRIGIIGCGNISSIYLKNLNQVFASVRVEAVADLVPERARAQADQFGVSRVLDTEALLQDPQIDVVLNLTTPQGHTAICREALLAGKPVYVEKPLAIRLEDGIELQQLAASRGLLLGGAPDTFMGAGIQTCVDLIDQGVIGRPIGATAFMTCHGHESWHPDPEFYYKVGGGPMFDMGPYYLTALIALLGPVRRLTGSTALSFPQRTITSQKKNGQVIDVEVPTHVAGLIDFASGAVGMILTSFDVWGAELPRIEIYGSLGTLSVPDPNSFGGPVRLRLAGEKEFKPVEISRPYAENSRGLGIADLARAWREGKSDQRASGALALHVLEAMHGFHTASDTGTHVTLQHPCARPAALDPAVRY
ncbi:MAG: Gfo/Idh/MocA family oxidoreductase [Clostridiaceae bacterium]|jgi:predicted dehydrogenase|nr:Gfo/Idh/MocA family oxidoreductase [Clostridiaceae bacterium]